MNMTIHDIYGLYDFSWYALISFSWGTTDTVPFNSKPIFSIHLFLRMIKTLITYSVYCLILTGVTTAQLQRHLTNLNVTQIISQIVLKNHIFLTDDFMYRALFF